MDAVVDDPPGRRGNAYPALDVGHLITVLEKYKDLGMAAKIKSTVGDEVPQLEQRQVNQMLKQLRASQR
ncbi:unnamed protein product [Phaeothamnion confervicola]